MIEFACCNVEDPQWGYTSNPEQDQEHENTNGESAELRTSNQLHSSQRSQTALEGSRIILCREREEDYEIR